MDTLFENKQIHLPFRTCEYVLTLSLFVTLVLTHTIFIPPLFANDLIANSTVTTPTLKEMSQYIKEEMNPQIRQEKFENKIKSKYKGDYYHGF